MQARAFPGILSRLKAGESGKGFPLAFRESVGKGWERQERVPGNPLRMIAPVAL